MRSLARVRACRIAGAYSVSLPLRPRGERKGNAFRVGEASCVRSIPALVPYRVGPSAREAAGGMTAAAAIAAGLSWPAGRPVSAWVPVPKPLA